MVRRKIDKSTRNILLDTNIVSFIENEEKRERIISILKEAVELGYGIAVSELVYFELLNEASIEKEYTIFTNLDGVPRFSISKKVAIVAGRLGSFYKESGIDPKQIESGDRIMAATSVLNNCVIFTANIRDFPAPFFKEMNRINLECKGKGGYMTHCYLYFIEPDLEYIGKFHKNRKAPYLKKMAEKNERNKRLINNDSTTTVKMVK